MKTILVILLFASATMFAQSKIISVDSVALKSFIMQVMDENSSASKYTVAEIDAAIDLIKAQPQTISWGALTPSGFYIAIDYSGVPNWRQLYYKNLIINGVTTRVLTTERP